MSLTPRTVHSNFKQQNNENDEQQSADVSFESQASVLLESPGGMEDKPGLPFRQKLLELYSTTARLRLVRERIDNVCSLLREHLNDP